MATILKNTKNNIIRNRWLSLATILVATIVFVTASFFIGLSILAQRAVSISQTKAQLQIYFDVDAPESEISMVKDLLEKQEGIEEIEYIDQEEALQLYMDYYSDDPELIDSVSAEWLPPSLDVRAQSLEFLEQISEVVEEEQKTNPYIDEVVYHKDIVDQLKSISNGINVGAIAIISIFSIITISLVFITISFNINSHKREIEIMHLIGTRDGHIKMPFILEGVFYTTIGSIIAATLIIVPLYIIMQNGNESNLHYILIELTKELKLDFITEFNFEFVGLFYFIHIAVGAIVGLLSSSFSVMRNLTLKEK